MPMRGGAPRRVGRSRSVPLRSRREPVHRHEPLDAAELLGVFGHEYRVERFRVGRDHEVVGADQSAPFFKVRANGAVPPRGGDIQGKQGSVSQIGDSITYTKAFLAPMAWEKPVGFAPWLEE